MRDINKSLSQLENHDWGDAPKDAPPYIKKICRLRYKPVRELNVSDLQLLISQDVGLKYLMPIAVNVLKNNPLVEGEHYCGDLLHSLLLVNNEYYVGNEIMKQQVKNILKLVPKAMNKLDEIDKKYTKEALDKLIVKFNKS